MPKGMNDTLIKKKEMYTVPGGATFETKEGAQDYLAKQEAKRMLTQVVTYGGHRVGSAEELSLILDAIIQGRGTAIRALQSIDA